MESNESLLRQKIAKLSREFQKSRSHSSSQKRPRISFPTTEEVQVEEGKKADKEKHKSDEKEGRHKRKRDSEKEVDKEHHEKASTMIMSPTLSKRRRITEPVVVRVESIVVPVDLNCNLKVKEADYSFDASSSEEVTAGESFEEIRISISTTSTESDFEDGEVDSSSQKRRLSFIGKYYPGNTRFSRPRTITGAGGKKFTPFFTKKYVFSNHFPCKFTAHGKEFNCSEQYYMYQKARVFSDQCSAEAIMAVTDPKEMKGIGRLVRGFDQAKWNTVSLQVMKTANYYKFVQNKPLRLALFETAGSTLVEASKMDKIWGVGLDIDHEDIANPDKWPGENQLGYLLTKLRDYLMQLPEFQSSEAVAPSPYVHMRASLPIFNYGE